MIYISGTFASPLFRALSNIPAGGIIKQFFYALYTDLLIMDKVSETPDPFYVIFRVISVFIPSGRLNQTVLFIKSQGLICGSDQLRDNADWIQRHRLFFFFS
jgi:hypothetical protein